MMNFQHLNSFSCLDVLIKMQSSVENVYVDFFTSGSVTTACNAELENKRICHRHFKTINFVINIL